jgi:hypothetical protein
VRYPSFWATKVGSLSPLQTDSHFPSSKQHAGRILKTLSDRSPGSLSVISYLATDVRHIHLNQTSNIVFVLRDSPGIRYQLSHARERNDLICFVLPHQRESPAANSYAPPSDSSTLRLRGELPLITKTRPKIKQTSVPWRTSGCCLLFRGRRSRIQRASDRHVSRVTF